MTRHKSHFQGKEPILERFLQLLRFRMVFPYVKRNSKVLDLGCGHKGALLTMLSPNINEGIGVDISVTNKKIANNIKLYSQKVARLPNNYFDLATSLAVVEHLDKPDELMKTAYKSLKKNGKLIITTPSPLAKPILEFLAFKLGIVSKQEIEDHKKYFKKNELTNLLITCGFKNKNIEVKNFSLGLNTLAVAKK